MTVDLLTEVTNAIAGRDGWRARGRAGGEVEIDVTLADGRRFAFTAPPTTPADAALLHVERATGWDPPVGRVDVRCMRCRAADPEARAVHTATAYARRDRLAPHEVEWVVACGDDVVAQVLDRVADARAEIEELLVGLRRRDRFDREVAELRASEQALGGGR